MSPEKLQAPNSKLKAPTAPHALFGAWSLEFRWSLDVGDWRFWHSNPFHQIKRRTCCVFAASLFLASLLPGSVCASGFLHVSGVTNLDINNQPIVLRGVNLGNW